MFPSYYEARRVGELYVERAGLVADAARAWARAHGTRPAAEDRERIAAFGIDVQVAFCHPDASLFVPGAVEDTRRAVEWIYRNLPRITALHLSLDTHSVFQIFHPSWWVDADGAPAPPFTQVSAADVRAGRWRATAHARESEAYVRALEASGKYTLTVWPYHALLGGASHALMPALMEAAVFHAVARAQPTRFETKGAAALTENYSVIAPEVTQLGERSVGAVNRALLDALDRYDRVYVFGQAKSHCVLATLRDLAARAPALAKRVVVLEDAMSPVPPPPVAPLPAGLDFPRLADDGVRELVASAGMRVARTSDAL
jgi:nicotinamidase-related amidase